MGLALIECSSDALDVAKAAVANAGGKVHGVFQEITRDSFWLKVEIESCASVVEGGCIPICDASIDETDAGPMLCIGCERGVKETFRLVQEVK